MAIVSKVIISALVTSLAVVNALEDLNARQPDIVPFAELKNRDLPTRNFRCDSNCKRCRTVATCDFDECSVAGYPVSFLGPLARLHELLGAFDGGLE